MCKVSVIIPVYNVEKYIRNMLQSVRSQSFKDFEAVIVNDGSTDNSRQIIEEFCQSDSRFRCFDQPNEGVASARNKGIKLAEGEYVVFYDPDDYIPPGALESMYKTASRNHADMVIGVMVEKSLGETLIYMHSQKLAKQKKIDPLDQHFFGAWSLCHKMFSLRFIRENDLKIEDLSNAEDGVFTFCALNCARNICGCDAVAYNYIKRPFWLAPSATQTISSRYLNGLLDSHDRILEEAERLAEERLPGEERPGYLEPLFVRFIEGEMVNGYYRGIWRASEDLTEKIAERTEIYRNRISEESWNGILRRNSDLELEKGFRTAEEMASEPLVTIVVTGSFDRKKIDMLLGSIYNQLFPRFEVMIDKKLMTAVSDIYIEKPNFRIIEGDKATALKAANGRYIIFMNEFAMFTKNSLRIMAGRLENNPELAFVSMLMKRFDGADYAPIPALSAAYGYTRRSRKTFSKLSECDMFLCNKLFRKAALEGFKFSSDAVSDIRKIYASLPFERLRKGTMITDMSEDEPVSRALHTPSESSIRFAYFKNEKASRAVEALKRHVTREDMEKIKKMLGRK